MAATFKGGLIKRNLTLPPSGKVAIDPATKAYIDQVVLSLQNGYSGTLAPAINGLGVKQIGYGTLTIQAGQSSVQVTFNAPFPDTNYALLISPIIAPTSIVKATTGFTVTVASPVGANTSADWAAVE